MDRRYTEAESIINNTSYKLKSIFENADYKGTENRAANNALEKLLEKLEDTEKELQYLSAPTKEGVLVEDDKTQKYYIAYDDGSQSYNLSCANSLEVLIEDEWQIGRVEATDGKYYFYGEGNPFLYRGMKVRKRIIE